MTRIPDDKGAGDIEVLRSFLFRPDDRVSFLAFYQFCHKLAAGSLGYLQRRGYRLPIGPHNSFSNISDLAIDILGPFLRIEKGVKYGVIYSYLAKEGMTDFAGVDPYLLMSKFRALLLGHVRQELYRLTQQEYPEAADLKKRLKRIFAGDRYSILYSDGGKALVCTPGLNSNVGAAFALVPREILEAIAEEAYLSTRTIEDWCTRIFELLAQHEEYCQAIPLHMLIAAAVKTSGTHLEIDAIGPAALPSPEQLMLSSELEAIRIEVVELVKEATIERFILRGRLAPEMGSRFAKAVELYLEDMSNGNQVDQIPDYFREAAQEEEHEHYLERYKYVFETIMSRAREEFIERLKKFR